MQDRPARSEARMGEQNPGTGWFALKAFAKRHRTTTFILVALHAGLLLLVLHTLNRRTRWAASRHLDIAGFAVLRRSIELVFFSSKGSIEKTWSGATPRRWTRRANRWRS